MPDALLAAYVDTRYGVRLPQGECVVRLFDDIPHEINVMLEAEGVGSWAIVTAMNPYSQRVPASENARRCELLAGLLTLQGVKTCPAVGKGSSGDWEERSLLVLAVSYDMARSLGTAFQQNAVLYGERDGEVELVFCDR
ncbi:MAG: DUF3293 domain-containing protein [Halioglobus sp.]